jgi:hypothetical protein
MNDPEKDFDDYFGVCPHCRKHSGYINVGRGHWMLCDEHKVKWFVGSNLFDSWRFETEDEQRKIYDERGIGGYQEVKPFHEPLVAAALSPPPASNAPCKRLV